MDKIMQECERLFLKLRKWDRLKDSVEDLKLQVATFRFLFAHAMPFCRGSAAIGEWLEMAIYGFHGFEICRYIGEGTIDLEALVPLSFEDYLRRYNKMIDIA